MTTNSTYPEFDLSGKIALVTGAGRGMGSHIAVALARYGCDVAICSRTRGELETVAADVERCGRKVFLKTIDLTRIDAIEGMVKRIEEQLGSIDVLVNNAGINIPQWAEEVTEEAWEKVFAINLKAQFFCTQAVGKRMINRRRGKIIMMSSQAGSVGLIQRSAYCSSKGALNQLTRVLAVEWAKHNINVNAIAPTFIEGPFTKPMLENEEFKDYVMSNILLGRIGQPQDVIGAVIYLASNASNLVTGSILTVDGGWTAQ
jgi:2-deoxy-D-gluconate 3-dehydrogenase